MSHIELNSAVISQQVATAAVRAIGSTTDLIMSDFYRVRQRKWR